MDDQGAADVYRPLQFDQPEDGSMLPAAPVAENATLGSSLVPCDGGELQELIPSPAHHVVGGTMVDGVLDVEMAAVTTHARRGARESSSGRGRNGGVKRKRGRKGGRTPVKAKKSEEEEDVCFICFDGGNLVLCDRKMCPKAYHPTCVNRDEAFFRKKGRWNCGWHLCSICAKAAHFLCYTCTYSLCKGCIRQSDFLCVRANKGLCVNCMRLVMLIENKDANKENVVVDFDDKSSWEYLFKEYWQDVKRKMSLNREEVINASNPWKGTGVPVRQIVSSNELRSANNEQNDGSDNSKGRLEKGKSTVKRQRKKPRIDAADKVLPNIIGDISGDGASELTDSERWASKELLYFVEHLKGDKSTLSVFEVQSLLMEYVTKYQLRDPDKKSQILCDARLQNLFGRARLGHFEMLKLIDSHILKKETSSEAPKIQRGNSEDDSTQVELEGSTTPKTGSDKKRKMKKKADEGTAQANLNDYAAIDAHNINLVYLRRNLVEDLLDDMEKFQEKVVGSFVRIRISGSGNKQDMYRLVQVVGISKATKEYKTGKKSTDIMLEILNLNKTEAITTDSVSNQEFSEEECKRLRQSIKCGLISRLTVGEIQEKAKALQLVKVNDWLETEILKLGHLRDRASEKGRRKELRECVEKLQVLNDPAERARRLQEVPEVHADPNMDPNYESEETEEDDRKRGTYARPRDIGYPKRGWDALSPGKGVVVDGLDGSQKSSHSPWERIKTSSASGEPIIERGQCGIGNKTLIQSKNSCSHRSEQNNDAANRAWSQGSTQLSTGMLPEITSTPQAVGVTASANNTETEKMWHYSDPSGKIQGPFSMVQLRKWSTTGYFPSDLRIWRISEKQEDAILLSDALVGKFHQESSQSDLQGPYANAQNVGGVGRWDNSSHDSNLPGANYSTWAGSDQRDGNWKSSWKEADGFVSGSAEITRKDGQEAQSTSWTSSSMESLEPTQGHITTVSSTQDSLGGSTPWSSQSFGHSPKLPPSHVGHSYAASLQQTADTRVGVSGVKFNQPEGHMSTWSPTKPLAVQPSGTWNPSNGYDNHLSSLASATQSFGDGKKSNTENIPSKKLKEASPVANETSALGSRCNASIRTDRTDLSVSNLTQTSAGAKWLKDQTENKSVAPQSIDEPAGSVDNLRQQSSVTSQMENQISESKAADLHASVESESHLNNSEQHSSLTAIQSKDQTSESMTSDSQVLVEPVSAVYDKLSSDTAIQSVNQTSENESSVAQVSDKPLSPVNDLEQRSPTTATQPTITPTATDREQPNLVTSAMEPNSMAAGSTRIGGVWTSSQSAGAMSSSSSPEPTIGVVLDADKYPKIVPAAMHPVPSAGLGPSTHGLLQPVSADGLSHVIHNDGQHCNNNMSLDLLAQELSAGSDLTATHAETGSPDSLPEPMDTQDVLLANENSESSQFVIIAAEESTVDEIWDGLLDAEGGEPVTDFFPEDLEGDKVEGSIASTPFCSSPSQVDDSKRNLSESQISVPVEGSLQPDGWVSDSGFGSTASGCGASSTAASVPMSQGSEMTSRPVVYISNEKGERSCPASDQESLQQPVDISHGNIPRDGWLSPQTSPEVSEVIQSTNPTGIPHPCPEHDEDAGASMVTTDAAGSVSVASSNTADQGVHDVSWVPDSSPLLVSAGELTPATSGSGDVPPPVQNSQASNRLPGNLCVSASEEQAPSGKDVSDMVVAASNSQVTRVFSGDFSVSTAAEQARTSSAWDAVSNKGQHPQTTGGFSVSAIATAPVASSDTWSTPISINSSNVSSLPPPVTGNTSSGVANLYLGKSSYRSAAPESWGSPSKNLIGPTDKQGVPSSHSTWRPGGVSEPSVSRRSGWGQSVDSSRGGWSQQSGNTNSRWGVDSGNQRGGWEQQRREGDRYSGYGDRGGYGGQGHGMRPWSKPLGGGGGGSGSNVSGGGPRPPRGQKICKFYENGYCKKGSSCDFLHP